MFTAKDRQKCQRLYDKYYAGRKFYDTLYREKIREAIRPGNRVLDAGCGRYLKLCKELSSMAEMVGIDLDTTLETDNRRAPFAVRGDLSRLPFCSEAFDVVVSRSVVEHLSDPAAVFREFLRILRPGGIVIMVTPNKYDYVSIIASLTPHWFHQSLVSRIFRVPEGDIFPTFYRANTPSAFRQTLRAAGFEERECITISRNPAYLMFSPLFVRLGVLYERIASMALFSGLRGSLLGVFEKTASTSGLSESVGSLDRAQVEVP